MSATPAPDPAARHERPRIAVIGSLDERRAYDPPLREVDAARVACHELGRELALASCDLVVFSDRDHYAETLVVRGYATAPTPGGRVLAHPARHQEYVPDLPVGASVRITTVRDTGEEWEVPYYRTLLEADGVVLIGGGRSTRVAGILALAQGIPVVPLAAFGGCAQQVWVEQDRSGLHVTEKDVRVLGESWSGGSAGRVMGVLRAQSERRAESRRRAEHASRLRRWAESGGLVVAILLLIAALAAIVFIPGPGPIGTATLALLLGAPMCAAMSGALIRDSFGSSRSLLRACARGLGAGAVAVLTYVAAQLLTVPDLLETLDARRLLFFVVPVGFTAGFTFDLVFERLRRSDPPAQSPSRTR
ncbi:hypothetical protein [Nocardiopsis sp. MG754419]|uniref:hypothetical protein n=1 Tax=Nocardiopsis sp. MG754419 TaxID=2259865 RepID=UPI001BA93E66|nr:hypothetical protein [Nocardiopsis sp. MG754419]MBR8740144.1 hypothetical protein [Nocardiopsis sp. MG754419]